MADGVDCLIDGKAVDALVTLENKGAPCNDKSQCSTGIVSTACAVTATAPAYARRATSPDRSAPAPRSPRAPTPTTNCSGMDDKEWPEYPNGFCGYCVAASFPSIGCAHQYPCSFGGEQSSFGCSLSWNGRNFVCAGINTSEEEGFAATVNCGNPDNYYFCGTCSTGGTNASAPYVSRTQACH